ncbi:MAG: zinc ABC transporter substrate-binding protein [Lachnospiraceae bacterium]|nr:zinc ABC transporter substrate-binding protein [Lachnospiraceae bacterium]
MKRIIALIAAVALTVSCLTACGSGKKPGDDGTIHIVTTIFPEYDWVMSVLGDNPAGAQVKQLLDNGVDLHSYQPTVEDILTISTCDLFIYVGGESDDWVAGVLREARNKNMKVINLLDVLGDSAKEEELVEGMQEEEHDHDHDHEDGDDHEHEHDHDDEEKEYDEHVWLSLRNANVFVKAISDAMQKIDAAHADTYRSNAEAYCGKLSELDKKYREAVDTATVKTVLFGDRFPFRYLTDDYNLTYYAAFVGCSAETEASFETIAFLSKKVDELKLSAVLTIENSDKRIASTIVSNTSAKNQKILAMDSMQSTTTQNAKNGTTYLSVMEKNLEVLREALK